MLDNMGIPNSSINLSLSDGTLMSPADGEILISLKQGHRPTEQFIDRLNADLPRLFPAQTFFFQPADIVTQVLNFGIAAPIDVQIDGPMANETKNLEIAEADVGQNPLPAGRIGRTAGPGSRRPGRSRQCRSDAGQRGRRHAAAGRQRSAGVSQRNGTAFPEFLDQSAKRDPIQCPGSDAAVQDGYDVRSGQHPGRAAEPERDHVAG